MNKISKFFALAAAVAMVGCSDNNEPSNPNEFLEGETAYINVAIRDANSRAAEGEFEYGTDNEGKVSTAHFYFFDAKGVYVGQANIWDGGTPSTANPAENIEFRGSNVVVLNNLQGNTYPNYMITVLNGKEYTDAELTGKSMAEFSQFLTTWDTNIEGGFQMATTSYLNGENANANHVDTYYYATKLETSNFYRTAAQAVADTHPVNVYVERLAARVEFDTKGYNEDGYYKVVATIAGLENGEVGEDNQAATEVYVKINNWGLNQTIADSYLSKQLGDWTKATTFPSVTTTALTAWNWNDPANFRSYWGQGTQYGAITKLNVFTAADMNLALAAKAYCNENTTTAADLTLADNNLVPNQTKTTNVEIMATVCTKNEAGEYVALDLVEHNGVYFTKDRFLAYAINVANQKDGMMNYYTKVSTTVGGVTTDVYNQIGSEYFTLAGDNNRVYLTRSTVALPTELYAKQADGTYEATTYNTTDEQLKNLFGENIRTRAFTGGQMHYTVPVAHLNDKVYETAADGVKDLKAWGEGSFGVVRNHAYKVNVNKVLHLGQGVFDPNQNIVTDKDPKTPEWYLGATINILSWKIVNNNVEL